MQRKISRFFSVLLVICMILSMIPATALAAAPGVLYLKPNSEWRTANARFAAYFFKGQDYKWVSMTDSDGDGYYEVNVPSGYDSVIFVRMNPSSSQNLWDYKWNQTGDLSIPHQRHQLLYHDGRKLGQWHLGFLWLPAYQPQHQRCLLQLRQAGGPQLVRQ